MAIILDATPGSETANSYATIEQADSYHEAVSPLHSEEWDALDAADKTRYLVWATRLIDENWTFIGKQTSDTQALQWPRTNVPRNGRTGDPLLKDDIIPGFIVSAVSEYARNLATFGNVDTTSDVSGIKEVSAGGAKIVFADGAQIEAPKVIPDSVTSILRRFGISSDTQKGSISVARVVRS